MSDRMKKLVLASMGVAGLVAFLSVVDLVVGFPFKSHMELDICFIVGAALVGYLGYDSLKDVA